MYVLSPATLSDARILAAYVLFLASYLVFALGKFPGLKIDRTGAAIIGAVGMVAFRIMGPREALRFVDFSTIVLLFSMMLIVGNLHLVGFFEWNAEAVLRRLKPQQLLPAVIFTCGLLSAFFVNDIDCLVMVPFVLNITRRMGLEPLPYLLAVATASNIGSVATITGNAQNMLIGSFSGIRYRDFLVHLAPVALVGLLVDWGVLHWVHMRKVGRAIREKDTIPMPPLDLSRLTKPAVVVGAVVVGFFAGVDPALMAALGAAVLLITRTLEPQKLYKGRGLGAAGIFCEVVPDRWGRGERWNYRRIAGCGPALEFAANRGLHDCRGGTLQHREQCAGGHACEVAGARVCESACGLAGAGDGINFGGEFDDHGERANIIVVESAKPKVEIEYRDYLRVGAPITVITLLVGWAWLSLAG